MFCVFKALCALKKVRMCVNVMAYYVIFVTRVFVWGIVPLSRVSQNPRLVFLTGNKILIGESRGKLACLPF